MSDPAPSFVVVLVMERAVVRIPLETIEIPHLEIVGDQQQKGDEEDSMNDVTDHPGKKSDGPDDDQYNGDGDEHVVQAL
jgi:hypothetical protein